MAIFMLMNIDQTPAWTARAKRPDPLPARRPDQHVTPVGLQRAPEAASDGCHAMSRIRS